VRVRIGKSRECERKWEASSRGCRVKIGRADFSNPLLPGEKRQTVVFGSGERGGGAVRELACQGEKK